MRIRCLARRPKRRSTRYERVSWSWNKRLKPNDISRAFIHMRIAMHASCEPVLWDDGRLGEQYLREFQDNEKTIPTILTTSEKLSTGVDARNIRNIVLMRPINSMIEFKQIIGRGTRLYDGKDYFTIYDFVKAHHHFSDPEWDGEPIEPEPQEPKPSAGSGEPSEPGTGEGDTDPSPPKKKIKINLADGKSRTIQHMM